MQSKKSNRPESLLRGSLPAISNYFEVTQGKNLISHEIRNLVKALIKSETKAPSGRTSIMPMKPFVDMFSSWEENKALSIPKLRQKAITLLTIASLARPSDLAPKVGFFRDRIHFNEDGSMCVYFFGVKNDANRAGFETRIESTVNPNTDPVSWINRDGDFADFSAFADFFSVLPIFRISADFCRSEL